jgi:hypothetical protein
MIKYSCFILLFLGICRVNAQQKSQENDLGPSSIKFSVSKDTAWTSVFKRSKGWFGGDGIYTIPINGKEHVLSGSSDQSMIIFSDSMIGELKENTIKPGEKTIKPGEKMVHNAFAILKGNEPTPKNIKFYWHKNKDAEAESVFVPKTPKTENGDYYWLGDGFVNSEGNGALYIFGYRVRTLSSEAFGFKEVGNTLIKLNIKESASFKNIHQKDTPFYLSNVDGEIGSFGAGIYVNTKSAGARDADGYIYVYGVEGKQKNLMVARVAPKDVEIYDKWQFWDGKNWVANMSEAAHVTSNVSNELSVSQLTDGRYALIFQVDGMSTSIGMRLANNLTGPWGPIIKLWDCKDDLIKKSFVVYNAKAHPSLSAANELLISYNINSVDFVNDLKIFPQLYRPRFIRVKFN